MTHTLSATGFGLVRKFEGFRALPEALPQGGWMVGHGHVRVGSPGKPLTKIEAGELLALDLAATERLVNAVASAPIRQSQFDALVSFAFSIGEEAFVPSQVLRRANAGEYVAAACAMDAWRKAEVNGAIETVETLVRRRAAEKALFMKDLPLEATPSVLMRAKLDHAASILGAPAKTTLRPPAPARRLTEILMSEPATEALLLTEVVRDDFTQPGELTTAHAAPVARQIARKRPAPWFGARKIDLSLVAENFGLMALMVFGLALISIGGSIMFGGRGDGVGVFAGSAVLTPGIAAMLMAGLGLRQVPRLRPLAA